MGAAQILRRPAQTLWEGLLHFPWRTTVQTLRARFRADDLSNAAASLSFTTAFALVPFITVALAVFSLFPAFARVELQVRQWLLSGLIPPHIAEPMAQYLSQFSAHATQMGVVGAVGLLLTVLVMVWSIDLKLNEIWRVRRMRSFMQRLLIYWSLLTLGPLLIGLSLSLTSYALSVSQGWVQGVHGLLFTLLEGLEFAVIAVALGAMFRYVPNASVRWSHALAGGLFAALGVELVKGLLAWYLVAMPTLSLLYGTLATLPILLFWVYLVWVIVLLGAVVAAYLPSLLAGVARRGDAPGWHMQLALEALAQLQLERHAGGRGLPLDALAARLRVDTLQLEAPLEALQALDWVGRLDEGGERFVLLVDPAQTAASPLLQSLLLPVEPSTLALWQRSRWSEARLADLLPQHGV